MDTIIDRLKIVESARPVEPVMKIAIVGKRNAGKSSIVNAIVGDDRVIVSETPGTTRDAIDIRFEKDGQTIVVIDTPGVKKKSKLADNIEFYSFVRATSSVRRADVVLLMIDATTPVSVPDSLAYRPGASPSRDSAVSSRSAPPMSTVTSPPDGIASRALMTRFMTTCSI